MLDNLLSERVEKWKNKALFERKSVALKDLNKEMEEGSKELDMLLKKKKKLYDASGKDEDEDDRDAEDPLANLDGNENSADFKGRTERLAVRLQIREAESSIDGITRDLDLLNTDLEDLAQHLEARELGTPSNKNKKSSESNWEEIGREIIDTFSLHQCQTLLWDQIGEKATLLEMVKDEQFKQQEARDEAKMASTLADNISRQLAYAIADMHSRLQKAESQRVQDVWALLRTQERSGSVSPKLSDAEMSSATLVAIQRAQDLEMELEGYISSDDRLCQVNEEQTARIAVLEASLLSTQLRVQMSQGCVDDICAPDGSTTTMSSSECFESLSSMWNSLGLDPDVKAKTVSDIQMAGIKARECAWTSARNTLQRCHDQTEKLQKSLTLIANALGKEESFFFGAFPGIPTALSISDRLLSLAALPRLAAVRDAVDAATAVMTVRASELEKLKERLLDTMSEMWLDVNELPDCLKNILGVDFHAAAAAANRSIEDEASVDSSDDVDEIAAFMVTSATFIANQLVANHIVLSETNTADRERAMRTLNVTRAKLTLQMVSVREETAKLSASLQLDSDSLRHIVSNGTDVPITDAQEAAFELVLGSAVSNPPGSQQLITAVLSLKSALETLKSHRETASVLTSKFVSQLDLILIGEERKEDKEIKTNEKKLIVNFSLLCDIAARAEPVKSQLVVQLRGLLKQSTGYSDEGSENELISSLLSLKFVFNTPASVSNLETYLKELKLLLPDSKDKWLKDEIMRLSISWDNSDRNANHDRFGSSDRDILMQVTAQFFVIFVGREGRMP